MRALKLNIEDFRLFHGCEIVIGRRLTAIAGNNGTGKSTVLGLLANSSQLRKHKTLMGRPYRGEFAELFKGDRDHDPSGKRMTLEYLEGSKTRGTIAFRTTWQGKDEPRFRIIPKRELGDGRKTEAKLVSPVIYLGLSRLYPIGEIEDDVRPKGIRLGEDDQAWFSEAYSRILSIHDEIRSVKELRPSGGISKSGTGIETPDYGPITNSAGQDNLGQILIAVLSLKRLRAEMGEEWDGGMLLVDELDAALHPAAQLRLLRLLLKESKGSDFQVVFTTHSETVLRNLSEKNQHNSDGKPGDVEVAYLTCDNGPLRVLRNPSWQTIENGLYVTNPALNSRLVEVCTEDTEARWLLRELLEATCPQALHNLELLEVALGCGQMMSLYTHDFQYFRDRIVVFDGDVTDESLDDGIPEAQRLSGGNVVRLPGGTRPESVLWDYLKERPEEDSSLWRDLDQVGIHWHDLVETPPDSIAPKGDEKERDRYKLWFRRYERLFSQARVVEHWAQDNRDAADSFLADFLKAYNKVASRKLAPLIEPPMAKRDSAG